MRRYLWRCPRCRASRGGGRGSGRTMPAPARQGYSWRGIGGRGRGARGGGRGSGRTMPAPARQEYSWLGADVHNLILGCVREAPVAPGCVRDRDAIGPIRT